MSHDAADDDSLSRPCGVVLVVCCLRKDKAEAKSDDGKDPAVEHETEEGLGMETEAFDDKHRDAIEDQDGEDFVGPGSLEKIVHDNP